MKRLTLFSLIAATTLAVLAPAARGQSYNPFQIGAAGGIAFPTGDLGNATNTGYNVTVAVGYKPQFTPIGVRAEAAYNSFGFQGGGGNVNIPAFTGNLIFGLPYTSFSPYVIGGAGLYRPSVDFSGTTNNNNAENHFGFNIGGGVKIPFTSSFETFVEARYNRVTVQGGSLSFIPVTFGVMF
ncbi:MAG: outer membrane beta-barrel protein [Gemmatimonadaceae bacterium]